MKLLIKIIKSKPIEYATRVMISMYSMRQANKIIKGTKTISDVPERFRECVNEAMKIIKTSD